MSKELKQFLREQAAKRYRLYIIVFQQEGELKGFLVNRAERFLVRSVTIDRRQRPTRAELLEAYRQLIETVEAEFTGQDLPPRPHGL